MKWGKIESDIVRYSGIMCRMKKTLKSGTILLGILFALFGAFAIYLSMYYPANSQAKQALYSDLTVSVSEEKWGLFFDGPGSETALIFYPGAKVEHVAYAPLMKQLADNGMDCFLVRVPERIAFFDRDTERKIRDEFQYDEWYLGGHSLGGVVAASYASKYIEELDGVIFFASYPTKELKKENFKVLSVCASKDGVINREKLEQSKSLMPEDAKFLEIEGGNHAGFGEYGEQKGDESADILPKEQRQQCVDFICDNIFAASNPSAENQ